MMAENDFDNKRKIPINVVDESAEEKDDPGTSGVVWEIEESDDSLERQVAALGGDMDIDIEDIPSGMKSAKGPARKDPGADQLKEQYLRMAADFENYRKRMSRERAELIRYCNENLLREILPIKDDLERAIEAGSQTDDHHKIVEGMNLILSNFSRILEKSGVTEIKSVGEKFDPNVHEAMTRIESIEVEENTVLQEFKKGYMLEEKLLRPAQVVVSVKPSGSEEN